MSYTNCKHSTFDIKKSSISDVGQILKEKNINEYIVNYIRIFFIFVIHI